MGRLVLKILDGPNAGMEQILETDVTPVSAVSVGAPLAIPAEFRLQDGQALLVSKTPLLVNGAETMNSVLRSGDQVQFGPGGPTVQIAYIDFGKGFKPAPTGAGEKPCPFCHETVKAAAVKCPHCKSFLKPQRRERPREQRDLKTEAHFLAIGFWWRIFALLALVLIGFLVLAVLGAGGGFGKMPVQAKIVLMGVGGALVLGFFVGLGLSRFQNWARIMAGALCLLYVGVTVLSLTIPLSAQGSVRTGGEFIGQLIGMLVNVVLYLAITYIMFGSAGARICSPNYRQLVAETPDIKAGMTRSVFFWVHLSLILLALLAAVFGLLAVGTLSRRGM